MYIKKLKQTLERKEKIKLNIDVFSYWLGVFLAILAGIIMNYGILLQKQVIVSLPKEAKFMRTLIRTPRWIIGLILSYVIAGFFYILAMLFIGPALVPGLLVLGIIVLAIGAVKIIGDSLKKEEIVAIILMIIATFLISFSGLSIAITEYDFIEINFIIRLTIFTSIFFIVSIILELIQRKFNYLKGFSLALIAGFMYALTDFWMGILVGLLPRLFQGLLLMEEVILFIICGAILIITNVFAVVKLQQALKQGVASNIMVIQQIPINFIPILAYLAIFLLIPPNIYSILLLIAGSLLIIICSYLLGSRQIQLEKIH
ncbi:MAG: hypothetical protein ACTSWE_05040 [Promethearchaeota archaeon]